ncbi:MAG: hypothetical protein D6722_13975 [Bacteroidetes bacterium]|nr:MAG: hypothetical protein D6722_13975 [Bacteroidota bacterium]
MKKSLFSLPLLTALLMTVFSGCIQDRCEQTMTFFRYEPVYMSYSDLRSSIGNEDARPLEQPGKLYFKDAYIFVSEVDEGIHVIDNSDPSNPQPLTFIRIPGNRDLAIKGNVLYADSYIDLVALDISDPTAVTELSRTANVFPYGMHHPGLWADESQGVAIDFIEEEVTETVDCRNNGGWSIPGRNFFMMEDAMLVSVASSNSSLPRTNAAGGEIAAGVGGSMARFTLVNNYLYTVSTWELVAFNLDDLAHPTERSRTSLSWDVETIFPMNNNLFIGTMQGMIIMQLDNPEQPTFRSEFRHANACDPVVAEGDYAFVTLRDGTECQNFTNQLEVVNISNLSNPWLVKTYPMHNPHGLGIRNGVLFICDGDDGLKVYDASDVMAIDQNQLAHFPDIHAFDVIPLYSILLMIGEDGLYQYDYSDPTNIQQISFIPVERE